MKKLVIAFGFLVFALTSYGQLWDSYYHTIPLDSINDGSVIQFLVEDEDSTHVLYLSVLDDYFEVQLNNEAGLYAVLSDVSQFVEAGDAATLLDGTAWRVFYTDGSGNVTELALGADGTYLMSNGATAAPSFSTPAGSGDVSKVGTPANDQVGVWTGDGTIEGDADMTFDGSNLTVTGTISSGGNTVLTSNNLSPAASDLWFTSDTIVLGSFSKDTTRTTDFYGSFYNDGSDTLVVTSMTAVLQGSSPSVAVDVQWHATFNSGSATHLNTTPPTITSTTTGDSDTAFDNAQIPPGVWVWMETPTVTTPATYISVSLSGYRLNRAY